ncbi:glyoxalase/bleomycin resistance/extradiol dioxygenase family protein [Fulvivirga sp. M361]|uniref:VOC family protein n=1 Tax=Fulvivirga sp. M361 TaxID=2594266 RepID=UPI00117A21E7|nr:VOC family protein [Fulvivirga sp. M361]TRX59071.1 glyoxalase/bleomycin resistance/extradiol dioxygenase family protein [Fulvivirga sp. M361]
MTIEHVAMWVQDLEKMKDFYVLYFGAEASAKYVNQTKNFTSYFLHFGPGRTRLELMTLPDAKPKQGDRGFDHGLAHMAISVGGEEAVDNLTERLRKDGYTIAGEPRTTGDGYYESVVLDPEGNYLEISA